MDNFYNDFIKLRSCLRDFPAIPRNLINEHLLKKWYKKTTISKYLKELRKEHKLKYVYIADEYSLWRRWRIR